MTDDEPIFDTRLGLGIRIDTGLRGGSLIDDLQIRHRDDAASGTSASVTHALWTTPTLLTGATNTIDAAAVVGFTVTASSTQIKVTLDNRATARAGGLVFTVTAEIPQAS